MISDNTKIVMFETALSLFRKDDGSEIDKNNDIEVMNFFFNRVSTIQNDLQAYK